MSLPVNTTFEPLNEFELKLDGAARGEFLPERFDQTLLEASVWVLADKEMTPGVWDFTATPLVITDEAGSDILVAFSHPSRAAGWAGQFPSHPHPMLVDVAWLLGGVPDGVGVAVNLGWPVSLLLPPDRVKALARASS